MQDGEFFMMDILRDPLWQTILGIVAIIISIGAIRLQQNIKELSCKVLSIAPLFNIKDDMQGKLKFSFDDKPVKNAFLIILKIVNSGKVPITADDQKRAITIDIGAEKILAVEIIETQPADLGANISTNNSSIILEPTLLNSNETVTIKSVVESFSGKVSASARIVGLKQITMIMPNSETKMRWLNKSVLISTVMGVVGIGSLILASITFTSPPVVTISRTGSTTEIGATQTVTINNCGATSEATMNRKYSSAVFAFIDDELVNESGSFDFPDVGSIAIGQKLANAYGLDYGQSLDNKTSVQFSALPGTHMEYEVRYVNVFGTGEVQIFQPSKNRITTYDYKILNDITIETVSSRQISCTP